MNDKQTLFWMHVATISGLMLLSMFLFQDSTPETRIQIAQSTEEVVQDELVKPAAAEVELSATPLKRKKSFRVRKAVYETTVDPNQQDGVIRDNKVKLCQGVDCGCGGSCSSCNGSGVPVATNTGIWTDSTATYSHTSDTFGGGGFGYGAAPRTPENLSSKFMCAVDANTPKKRWGAASELPFEQYAYGEYIGPFRTPHVPDYRIRVGDQLEFVYLLTRRRSNEPYRLYVGDTIQVTSATDSSLNQPTVQILSDGTISLPLIGTIRASGKTINNFQRELNDRYTEYVKSPEIVVQVVQGNTPLQDLRDAVDARQGNGGQSRNALVSPDGTIQLPLIGSVPAIGLTLEEIGREVNARYRLYLGGIVVTPILTERAARFVYVVGEVGEAGRFELTGPTTVMQAIALAQGFNAGGNLRQVVVLRRDANWQLIATRLDLNGAFNGRRPYPADEIWLRDSDIVLVPKKPIQRLSEAVNQYLSTTLYAIFPQQGVAFNFDDFVSL